MTTAEESATGPVGRAIFDKQEGAWYEELLKLSVREIAALHLWARASASDGDSEDEEGERFKSFMTACEDAATANCMRHWLGAKPNMQHQ